MNTAKEVLVEAGLDKFHWGIIIIKAEMGDGFEDDEDSAAGSWMSCACGKLDDHVERGEDGEPLDERLYELGLNFHDYVACNEYLGAALTLVEIHDRSIDLFLDTV
jgi:hypothetical protein